MEDAIDYIGSFLVGFGAYAVFTTILFAILREKWLKAQLGKYKQLWVIIEMLALAIWMGYFFFIDSVNDSFLQCASLNAIIWLIVIFVGLVLLGSGKKNTQRIIEELDRTIQLKPDDAEAYFERGKAHHENGDLNHAILDLSQSININANHALAYYFRGQVYAEQGKKDRAIADFNKVMELCVAGKPLFWDAQKELEKLGVKET